MNVMQKKMDMFRVIWFNFAMKATLDIYFKIQVKQDLLSVQRSDNPAIPGLVHKWIIHV